MSFYNDNNDENIRLPDEVKKEILIYDNNNNYNNNYDRELEDALYQSIQLYENEMQKNEEFEQKIINQHSEEIKNRREILKPILFELNRIKNYDNKICKILEIGTRSEYDDEEEVKKLKEQIRLDKCNQDVKVMIEYKQILFDGVHDELLFSKCRLHTVISK